MPVSNAQQYINAAVMQWPEVTAGLHRFGGLEWRIGAAEIGHIHGNSMVDITFPSKVRDALVAAGRAEPHHIYPEIGISLYLNKTADIERAIELLRISYSLIQERRARLAKHIPANS